MEKLLRQFAPFVALVVAAALVVIADPGETSGSAKGEAAVAGVSATRTTTPASTAAAEVPTDATAPAGAEPFAPVADASAGAPSSSSPSSFSSSSFSSGSSSSSSSSSFASTPTPSSSTDTLPSFTTPSADDFSTPTTEAPATEASPVPTAPEAESAGSDFYLFDQVKSSAVCSAGGDTAKPLSLAPAFSQAVVAAEPGFPDRASDLTLNKADPDAERYIYRTHTLISNSAVSVTDTAAGNASRILSQRADWERLDGIVWSPANTLLAGENIRVQERPDPVATTAKAGLVYEINPRTGVPTVRPALGAMAHKGMSFDHLGNLYSVSATTPGYVYRFVPTVAGNYSAGTLSALWINPTGESMWLALPAADVVVDADAAARAAGATVLLNPEDAKVMIITSPSGVKRSQLFVSETGANRVLTVVLRTTTSGVTPVADNTAFSAVYVAPGLNAPDDFTAPSALMIDTTYNLYIAEHNGGGGAATKTVGDDIWVAPANGLSAIVAMPVGRLASVTDCDATPAGLMFDLTGSKLFLNLTGRGGDGRDMTVLITTAGGV
jgi:hypothetical protein